MVADNRRYNERDEEERETNSAGQSGDIQGMSRPAEADSESVEELVEEGNAFRSLDCRRCRERQRSRCLRGHDPPSAGGRRSRRVSK
jgi:hypothetical protein